MARWPERVSKNNVILSEAEESTVNEADWPILLTPDYLVLLRTKGLIRRPLRSCAKGRVGPPRQQGSPPGTAGLTRISWRVE